MAADVCTIGVPTGRTPKSNNLLIYLKKWVFVENCIEVIFPQPRPIAGLKRSLIYRKNYRFQVTIGHYHFSRRILAVIFRAGDGSPSSTNVVLIVIKFSIP